MDSENNFGNKIKKIYNELRKSEKKSSRLYFGK